MAEKYTFLSIHFLAERHAFLKIEWTRKKSWSNWTRKKSWSFHFNHGVFVLLKIGLSKSKNIFGAFILLIFGRVLFCNVNWQKDMLF